MAEHTGKEQIKAATHCFLQHEEMDHQVQCIPGCSCYGGADTGEVSRRSTP